MRMVVVGALAAVLITGVGAGSGICAQTKLKGLEVHGEPQGGVVIRKGMIPILKEQKLASYQSATIGKAFDSYEFFAKREWKETPSNNGKVFVDFTGWFENLSFSLTDIKNGIRKRGVEVKFVVYPGGEYAVVMISKVVMNSDGIISKSPIDDKKMVLDAIYGNKPIQF